MRLILTLFICLIISGCISERTYPPSTKIGPNDAKVNIFGADQALGGFMRLRFISEYETWDPAGTISSYSLRPGTYDLYYDSLTFINPSYSTSGCPTYSSDAITLCEKSTKVWNKHPYKITAELKNNHIYKSLVRERGIACLYGEPVGAPGQVSKSFGKYVQLSKNAKVVACGTFDTSITFDAHLGYARSATTAP